MTGPRETPANIVSQLFHEFRNRFPWLASLEFALRQLALDPTVGLQGRKFLWFAHDDSAPLFAALSEVPRLSRNLVPQQIPMYNLRCLWVIAGFSDDYMKSHDGP